MTRIEQVMLELNDMWDFWSRLEAERAGSLTVRPVGGLAPRNIKSPATAGGSEKMPLVSKLKIDEVVRRISESYHPDRILLFGSFARGTAGADSDIDLIVVKETKQPKARRGSEIRGCLRGVMAPLDLKVYTPSEFETELSIGSSFLSSVIDESRVVYER